MRSRVRGNETTKQTRRNLDFLGCMEAEQHLARASRRHRKRQRSTPFSPPSSLRQPPSLGELWRSRGYDRQAGPARRLVQGPPVRSKFLAAQFLQSHSPHQTPKCPRWEPKCAIWHAIRSPHVQHPISAAQPTKFTHIRPQTPPPIQAIAPRLRGTSPPRHPTISPLSS